MSKGSCLQTWTTITLFSREKTEHYQSKQSYVPRSAAAAACSKPHVTAPSSPRARTLLNPPPLFFWARLQVNASRLNALTDEAKARQLNCLRADSRTGQDAPQLSLLMGWSPAPSLEGHTWSSSRHFVPGTRSPGRIIHYLTLTCFSHLIWKIWNFSSTTSTTHHSEEALQDKSAQRCKLGPCWINEFSLGKGMPPLS